MTQANGPVIMTRRQAHQASPRPGRRHRVTPARRPRSSG